MKPLLAVTGVLLGTWLVVRGRRGGLFPFGGRQGQGQLSRHAIAADGAAREYALYVPPSAGPGSPLVVLLHGRGGGMHTGRKWGWEPVADANGLVLVYGQALRSSQGPNVGDTGWNHRKGKVDPALDNHPHSDVAYLDKVIADVQQKLGTRKVYLTGFSSGAMMVYRYAADRGHSIAGIAPLAGAIGQSHPDSGLVLHKPPANANASAILIHGGTDAWRGGSPPKRGREAQPPEWLPLADAVKHWKAALNATQSAPVRPTGVPMEWHQRWNSSTGKAVEVVVDKGRGHWTPTAWPWAEHVWRFWSSTS